MSKASRINKNKLQIYNLLRALQGIHPKQVQRKEMTLKHYKVMHRRLDKLEREKKKKCLDFLSLPIVQLTIRGGRNEQKEVSN